MATTASRTQISFELELSLKALNRLGRNTIQIVALPVDTSIKGVPTCTFEMVAPELVAWVESHNRTHNLYFTLNEAASSPDKKPSESDITRVHGIGFDCDPIKGVPLQAEKKRLRHLGRDMLLNTEYPPTYVIMSGNGIQGVFLFQEPLDKFDPEYIRIIGKRLQASIGADKTENLDRLYRLPGTVNLPTPSKQKRGYVQEQSGIMISPRRQPPRKYSLEEL